jgi:hypothetical protein
MWLFLSHVRRCRHSTSIMHDFFLPYPNHSCHHTIRRTGIDIGVKHPAILYSCDTSQNYAFNLSVAKSALRVLGALLDICQSRLDVGL